jgi:hypothetical protein
MTALHRIAAAPTKITTAIIAVDPAMATRWLDEHNTHNRDLSQFRVDEYTREMLSGRWHFNGEPIQFDRNGVLLNGQHRLWAVIQSLTTQTFLVVRGLEPSTQITMDQGTRRRPADQLQVAGIKVDNTVAAAMRLYIRWQGGRLFGDQVRMKPSTGEVVEWAQQNPDSIWMLQQLTASGIRRVPVSPSLSLAVALRFHEIDTDVAAEFFASLIDPFTANFSMGDPRLALLNRLKRTKESGVKLPERDLIAFFIITWNAERAGRRMSKLQRPNGAAWTMANFPIPVG